MPDVGSKTAHGQPTNSASWIDAMAKLGTKRKGKEKHPQIAELIGMRIRWAREIMDPNRTGFARAFGFDRTALRDVESGRRPLSIFLLIELIHALKISPNYVFWGDLAGVDGRMAARLVQAHPELAPDGDGDDRHGTAALAPAGKARRRRRLQALE